MKTVKIAPRSTRVVRILLLVKAADFRQEFGGLGNPFLLLGSREVSQIADVDA